MILRHHKIFQFLLFSICLRTIVPSVSLQAQVPANLLGLNPANQKWSSIENEAAKIIYPKGLDEQAQRVAAIVTYLSTKNDSGIGQEFKKLDIILHGNTVVPNGFVTVGPFRSEFYLSAPQFYSPTSWIDVLSIHEYRHVKQFSNSQRGLSRLGQKLLGSWAWGGLVSTALPRWFFEGDAILMETALTASGRGRLPAFDMEYKALALENKFYSYEKASAGSFKDYVPDWYTLGYFLTLEGREKYGTQIWRNVVEDATRYKGLFFPFSKALRKNTGLSTPKLYEQKFSQLYQKWQSESQSTNSTPLPRATPKTITHYNNITPLDSHKWLAVKRSFREWPHLIEVDSSGKEKKLCNIGITFDPLQSTLSVANNLVVWSELNLDPRWYNLQYQNIFTFDLLTGKKKKLTSKAKYFAPALAPDGKRIITVEMLTGGNTQLVLVDAGVGKPIGLPIQKENTFFSFPTWVDDHQIAAIVGKEEQASIQLYNLKTQKWQVLAPQLPYQISHLSVYQQHIYFSAAYQNTNNIYQVNIQDGQISQLTKHPIGAFQPYFIPSNQQIVFSGFSASGYLPQTEEVRPIPFDPIEESQALSSIAPIVQQESNANSPQNEYSHLESSLIPNIPSSLDLPIEKFKKSYHLFNPHSLLPYIYPPIGGVRLLSDNTFSTLSSELATYYNFNENKATYLGELVYGGWFTQIELGAGIYNRRANYANFDISNDTTVVFSQYSTDWTEKRIKLGLKVPLRWTSRGYDTRLSAGVNYQFLGIDAPDAIADLNQNAETLVGSSQGINNLKPFEIEPFQKDQLHTLNTQLVFQYAKRTAIQELGPDFGFSAQLQNRRAIGKTLNGNSWRLGAGLHLPGLMKTHASLFQVNYQKEDYLDNYKFPNTFFNPRGYGNQIGDRWLKYSIDYKMPLWYPDIALGPLAFLQRISAHWFYDAAGITLKEPFNQKNWIRSAGVELIFDVRLIRLLDVKAGVRYSYTLDPEWTTNQKNHQFDFFVLGISG